MGLLGANLALFRFLPIGLEVADPSEVGKVASKPAVQVATRRLLCCEFHQLTPQVRLAGF